MKNPIKVIAIYIISTHLPALRCIGFSSSYLATTFLYLFLMKNEYSIMQLGYPQQYSIEHLKDILQSHIELISPKPSTR